MTKLLLALLVVGQVATVKPTIVDPSEFSHYTAVRAPGPITIDGVLSDKEWGKVPAMTTFSDAFQPERPPKFPTTAKMMWDDKYLYLAWECYEDDIWGVLSKHDDPIYTEQAAEIFIDPEGKGRHYWEIDISPKNTVVDLMVPSEKVTGLAARLARYDVKGLLHATKVYGTLDDRDDKDEKWTAELAIPWADFAGRKVNVPPKDGDSWRMNLFRIIGPKPYPNDQYLSWSKSPAVYHQSKNFGVVTFKGNG
jgi:hypothetical protein